VCLEVLSEDAETRIDVTQDNGFLRVICVASCVAMTRILCSYSFFNLSHNGRLRRFQRRVGDDGGVKENPRLPKLTIPTLV